MSNITAKESSAELVDDINVITAEINTYQRVAGEAIFEIGRRLKHVKENDLVHGEWTKWLDDIGMSRGQAHKFIAVFDRFGNVSPVKQLPTVMSVLYELTALTDEQLSQEYEFPDGTKKKPVDMSRREAEKMKRIERERDEAKAQAEQAEQQAEIERRERERLEAENEELSNREPEVVTEYVEKEKEIPYDRTHDEPYAVEQGNDFYALMREVDEVYKKYAHLQDGIEELRNIARYDDDLAVKYRKASVFWDKLSEIFEDDGIVDAEIIY